MVLVLALTSETETASWLVRNHLVMSHIAFKRDPSDPQTVKDFVDVVQSLERLRLLLILTVCDIRAVGPNTWTEWKASLLRELFFRAQEAIAGGDEAFSVASRIEIAKEETALGFKDWDPDITAEIMHLLPAAFWLSAPPDELGRRIRVYEEARKLDPPLMIEVRPFRGRCY